jgi:hypothetical protein
MRRGILTVPILKESGMLSNIAVAVVHLAIGFVAGAFAPAVGRKIKALWVKETQVVEKRVVNVVDGTVTAVKAEVKKL